MSVRPGVVLGHYRLEKRIGAGGMAEVWRALDENLNRPVAVKIMGESIARDKNFTDRFLREARLVAGLDDPNVLPVYAFGTEEIDGQPVSYLVMKLVEGGSLKERISGPVPAVQAVAWLGSIATALDHAHDRGVLHRDVKPANVLLDSQGRPLLADFGLARSADSASGLTQTGTVLGTPLYMAPEQATGKALDGRTDQYALAIVAYEMLAGRVPFKADSPLGVLHQHVSTPPEKVSIVLPGLPEAADTIFQKALAKTPEERYPTCRAFVEALALALGIPVSASTVPAPAIMSPAPPPIPVPTSEQATVISKADSTPLPPPSPGVPVPTGPPALRPAAPPPLAAPASLAAGSRRSKAPFIALGCCLLAVLIGVWLVRRPRPPATSAALSTQPLPAEAASPPPAETTRETLSTAVSGSEASPAGPEPEPGAEPPSSGSLPPQSRRTTTGPEAAPRGPSPARPRPGSGKPTDGSVEPRPSRPARREPLLSGPSFSVDTTVSAGFEVLDTTRKPGGRLMQADFAQAMGEANRSRQASGGPTAEYLYTYARAGSTFAGGDENLAWQLMRQLYQQGGRSPGRTLVFVKELVLSRGARPGPDAGWILGLAFGDPRGDLDDELEKAAERSPGNGAVTYARALNALRKGSPDGPTLLGKACHEGVNEACR